MSLSFWGVWHAGNPIEDYARFIPRFSSEYGIQAFPLMSSIVRFTLPEVTKKKYPSISPGRWWVINQK